MDATPVDPAIYKMMVEVIDQEPNTVVRCWHPEPPATAFVTKRGYTVEIMEGAPAYQLSTGHIIEL